MIGRICCFVILLFLYTTPAGAAEATTLVKPMDGAIIPAKADFTELRLANTVTVRRVIDPLRLELTDGQIVQLAGIDIPDMAGPEQGDIAVAVTVFLRDLLEGKPARLYHTKDPDNGRTTRMGYQLAHLERQEGDVWVQGILLANGLARIYPTIRNPEMALQMLPLENAAREKHLGLWADKKNQVLTPDTAGQALHSLAIVEGVIRSTGMSNNRIYLNFGQDWRTDFTIGIEPAVRRKLSNAGINPQDLTNHKIRIHGWIEDYNGPYIDLASPVWLEIMPPPLDKPQ